MRGVRTRWRIGVAAGIAAALVPATAAAQHEDHSPYAGTGSAEVKTLTDAEVSALLGGEGMGLALPAELNGYPGPRHVLDLANALALSPSQRADVQAVFEAMQDEARRRGREVVDGEAALDAAFAAGSGAGELEALVRRVEDARARLRWTHLRAHLETAALLTPEQRHRYHVARGYGEHGSVR